MSEKRRGLFFFTLSFLLLFLASSSGSVLAASEDQVLGFTLSGTITSAHADAFDDALVIAATGNYSAVVIDISTPGGSVDAMLRIITAIDNSPVPVLLFVTPAGTSAWSAGTYILMASHLSAMAPNSVIGSCQPVSYSPFGSTTINDSKTINALVEVMVTHAKSRERNYTLAASFVLENTNVDDSEALMYGIIEYRAESLENFLDQADGRQVNISSGTTTLHTMDAAITEYHYRLREILLNSVADPLVSSLLFMIGIFAFIYGFSAPGHGGEVLGAIAILLALVGMGFNINAISVIMVIGGAILLIYELATPGFGLFGISGIILLALGALFLIPFSPETWAISAGWYNTFTAVILLSILIIAAIFLFAVYKVLQIRKKKPIIGTILGEIIVPEKGAEPGSKVFIMYNGEYWEAKSKNGIVAGRRYVVVDKDGAVLILEEAPQ